VVSEGDAFKLAKETGAPVMIDFYADWCPPCQELKNGVFKEPDVTALAKGFVSWRIDATVSDEKSDALMDKYDILGLPTILFAGADGTVYNDLTLTGGDIDRQMILNAMERALERSGKDGI
jgi:thiol:disulfide interchange protein DsbD